jgi:hypothetical protein
MAVVARLSAALPATAPVQSQLTALMSAIQAGVDERRALAAQGQLLLGLLVQPGGGTGTG